MERDGFFRIFGASPIPLKCYGSFTFFQCLALPKSDTRYTFGICHGNKFKGSEEAVCAGVIYYASPQVTAEGIVLPGKPGQFTVHFHVVHEMACQINPCLTGHGVILFILLKTPINPRKGIRNMDQYIVF